MFVTPHEALVKKLSDIISKRLPWLSMDMCVEPCANDIAFFVAEYTAKNKVEIANGAQQPQPNSTVVIDVDGTVGLFPYPNPNAKLQIL